MSIAIQDIFSDIKNYARNQNLTDDRIISAINTAIDFVNAHISLPGHERQFIFDYIDTSPYISLPDDVEEPIFLRFKDDTLNRLRRFSYLPIELIFEKIDVVNYKTALWSYGIIDGQKKLVVLTKNSTASIIIDTCNNSSTFWTASNDATNLTDDYTTYKEGSGSLKFDIDVSLSPLNRASLSRTIDSLDLTHFDNDGYFFCWVYIPNTTNFTSISLSWGKDSSNYWKQVATSQYDGSPFEIGWNEIAFPWYGATIVGSPSISEVKWIKLDFDYTADYVSTSGFRIDYLRISKPDKMIFTYYTTYRGKNSSGEYITKFTSPNDTFLFGDLAPSFRQLIAIFAAVVLNPQILVENTTVSNLYKDFITLYSRKYPKKKIISLVANPLIAKTSYD